MGGLFHTLSRLGFLGMFIFPCAAVAAAVIVVILFTAKGRKPLVFAVLMAFLPLLLGAVATGIGLWQVENTVATLAPGMDAEQVAAEGRRTAMMTTYFGAAFSAPLVVVSLLALAVKRPQGQGSRTSFVPEARPDGSNSL